MLDADKRRDIVERAKRLEDDIARAREYLETGEHSSWNKFQPLFKRKVKDGKLVPPHKDWVKNVFIPGLEKALSEAEKLLDRAE